MKTRKQIELQARALEEQVQPIAGGFGQRDSAEAKSAGRAHVLFTFPSRSTPVNGSNDGSELFPPTVVRRIEYAGSSEPTPYRLLALHTDLATRRGDTGDLPAVELASADNAFDVLVAGYIEEDRDHLREALAPILDSVESSGETEADEQEAAASFAEATKHLDLSPASHLRTRQELSLLMTGGLHPADFIERAVARQSCFEQGWRIVPAEQIREAVTV